MDEKLVGRTKHGELTLDQLASIQPGMARLMEEVAHRTPSCTMPVRGGTGSSDTMNSRNSADSFGLPQPRVPNTRPSSRPSIGTT